MSPQQLADPVQGCAHCGAVRPQSQMRHPTLWLGGGDVLPILQWWECRDARACRKARRAAKRSGSLLPHRPDVPAPR